MTGSELDDVRAFWDKVARDWRTQVGDEGDANRRLNSDPVLWHFLGDVTGLRVLDVGCGTGYLSRQLLRRGAVVRGVDLSANMIALAREAYREIDFQVDSASSLGTVADSSIDAVVANYVLMDTPDLPGALAAFQRVLKPGGTAVVVFSHPCFPQGGAMIVADGRVAYVWDLPYFEAHRRTDPPWGHFTHEFIWFHRPLSDYWKAFVGAGFDVIDFEEPRIVPERYALADSPKRLLASKTRPYSVAFKLRKPR